MTVSRNDCFWTPFIGGRIFHAERLGHGPQKYVPTLSCPEWIKSLLEFPECTFILADPADQTLGTIFGDVNLFLNDHENEFAAEIEVMIAEKDYRGKGIGRERWLPDVTIYSVRKISWQYLGYNDSIELMMAYGAVHLGLRQYQAKISIKNDPSLALFEHRLHYKVMITPLRCPTFSSKLTWNPQEIERSAVWKEITFEMKITEESQTEESGVMTLQQLEAILQRATTLSYSQTISEKK